MYTDIHVYVDISIYTYELRLAWTSACWSIAPEVGSERGPSAAGQ